MDLNLIKRGIEKKLKNSLEKRNVSKAIHSYLGGEVPHTTVDYIVDTYYNIKNIILYKIKKTLDSLFEKNKKYNFSL
jgi:hypothetical protein